MIAFAIAAALVGLAFVLAVRDVVVRMLAGSVRMAELRVEAAKRVELEVLAKRLAKLEGDVSSLDTAMAVGRRGR